jgi:arabinofuranan 3-O-arabinosyltransferase
VGDTQVVARTAASVSLQTVVLHQRAPQPVAVRSARVQRDQAEHRVVDVGPGPAALVVLAEGSNAGWRATANGHLLRPVTVDRWRQAFVLPPGGATAVDLTFVPGRWHRIGLGVGLLALVALGGLWLAFRGDRRLRADTAPSVPAPSRAVPAVAVTVLTGAVLGGPVGAAAGVVVVAVVGSRRLAVAVAVALFCVAGVAAAWSDQLSGGGTAQWAALGGLLVVLGAGLDAGVGFGRSRRRDRAAPALEQGPFEQLP